MGVGDRVKIINKKILFVDKYNFYLANFVDEQLAGFIIKINCK